MDKLNRRTFIKATVAVGVSRLTASTLSTSTAAAQSAATCTAYGAGSYGAGRYGGGACAPTAPMDVGVKGVSAGAKPRFLLHTTVLVVGTIASRVRRITTGR